MADSIGDGIPSYKLFIGGEFVESASGETYETIDPGTGEVIARVAKAQKEDARRAIEAARGAFDSGVWSGMNLSDRAKILRDIADKVAARIKKIAKTESRDSGGIISRTFGDASIGSTYFQVYGDYAEKGFPWRESIEERNPVVPSFNYIRREPIGVCAGIIPWNFPFMMAVWKISHAIAMGNTVVLKPASDTPLSALVLAEAIAETGLPKGVVNIITGPGGVAGEELCTNPMVDKIAFTGSTEVGARIMELGSKTIKKVTLELGGKSANIVLHDADLEMAVDGALFACFFHCGQVCESGTRLLLPEAIHDEFVSRMIERLKGVRIGYQLNPTTTMGPVVSAKQRKAVEEYIKIGLEEGATLAYGGGRPKDEGLSNGFFLEPAIFTGVKNEMRIAREEIFGPVLSVIKYKTEEEAVAIANDSDYGLAGGVWSRDIERAQSVASGMRTGTVWINDYHVFGHFFPFGGYKRSGVGREIGKWGLMEYTEIKHIHVGTETDAKNKLLPKLLLPS